MAAKRKSLGRKTVVTRKVGVRQPRKTFLIICEGLNTEPEYFNSFRLTSAYVRAIGKGLGTTALVREAITVRREEQRKDRTFDECWVVFDKDDFPDSDFEAAISEAEKAGFHVAWSNQAFEFWFILHFILYRGLLHRNKYAAMLTKLTGLPYAKKAGVASNLYNMLYPRLDTAIANAKAVLSDFEGVKPSKAESATTVFRLAEELKAHIETSTICPK